MKTKKRIINTLLNVTALGIENHMCSALLNRMVRQRCFEM